MKNKIKIKSEIRKKEKVLKSTKESTTIQSNNRNTKIYKEVSDPNKCKL